ncbi:MULTISPECIES: trans-aconitate 2-methyltransferase [unclassified Wenzhouxiangella]|uniref:class I SAM-dependent methyltransferase n=1 Tax=unclassified Wenzhouxiangella TaxID=2613841 RepID=UPI000E3273C4|nr:MULTISPECIES: class I SAM-dependent methyltransferase [unclassified Wenzhouxiangella]RFF28229.1 methyltransferase domain-containing protein [Wenzhouxiangella sp. 15181]RFP67904.1 methyltransferase domain-containing protein [Wenzhouxiangella sp. 15190]
MSRTRRNQVSLADRADRHTLYEESVQDPESELEFVSETFETLNGRPLRFIREDFCGTANTACHWVHDDPEHRAVGVDLDSEVLAWGREHHLAALTPEERSRIELIEGDVMTAETPRVDALLAMNFSYYLFTTRDSLRAYFERARRALVDDGILFLDAFGGYEAHRELEERTEYDDFTYVWDQASFDPIQHAMTCQIHFEFPDGSELKRAFEYHWRLWTLPEIRELLEEAGYSSVEVYWEGTDEETGEGNGIYEPADTGDADAGWICYLVARK